MSRAPRSKPSPFDSAPQPNPIITAIAEARAAEIDDVTINIGVVVGLDLAFLEGRVFELIAEARVETGKARLALLRRAKPYLEEACAQAEEGV